MRQLLNYNSHRVRLVCGTLHVSSPSIAAIRNPSLRLRRPLEEGCHASLTSPSLLRVRTSLAAHHRVTVTVLVVVTRTVRLTTPFALAAAAFTFTPTLFLAPPACLAAAFVGSLLKCSRTLRVPLAGMETRKERNTARRAIRE